MVTCMTWKVQHGVPVHERVCYSNLHPCYTVYCEHIKKNACRVHSVCGVPGALFLAVMFRQRPAWFIGKAGVNWRHHRAVCQR